LTLRPALVLAAIALLAACNKSPDTNRSASGEVLEGTISDNMLPLDKVTSQPPLAAPTGSGKGGAKAGAGAGADTTAADSGAGDTAAPDSASPAEAPAAASGE
jgi:hypothetical protein